MRARRWLGAALAALLMGCGFGDLRFDRMGSGGGAAGSGTMASSSGAMDPVCTGPGFACVPRPVDPWQGPVLLYDGDPALVPACPSAYPSTVYQGVSGLAAPPAQCAACTCGPANTICALPPVMAFTDVACMAPDPNAYFKPLKNNNNPCGDVQADQSVTFKAAPPTVTASTCAPAGGAAQKSLPTWKGVGLVCGGAQPGRCTVATSVCAAPAPAGFVGSLCVWSAGDASCPADYPQKHTLAKDSSVTDTRACSACGCATDGPATCSVKYTLYRNLGCSGVVIADLIAGGACQQGQQGGNYPVQSYDAQIVTSGSCPPTGGAPVGAVVPVTATTVCCQ